MEQNRHLPPSYVWEGMKVLVKQGDQSILCVVVLSAGDLARVENKMHKIDRWERVNDLRIYETETS